MFAATTTLLNFVILKSSSFCKELTICDLMKFVIKHFI